MLTSKRIVHALVAEQAIATSPTCGCYVCDGKPLMRSRMYLCATCGNKRCPHATDHRNVCTGSNEPGQPGSAYE